MLEHDRIRHRLPTGVIIEKDIDFGSGKFLPRLANLIGKDADLFLAV